MAGADEADIALVEIGGTVGDIESLPFLEAIRQLGVELGHENTLYMHLTLLPYIAAAGELKTKPTQHSVKELLSIGIQPDILLCRSDRPLPLDERRKIALFTNVRDRAVISAQDVDTIYRIPLLLHEQGLDKIVTEKLCLQAPEARLDEWRDIVYRLQHPTAEVNVAVVGKYTGLADAYKSIHEALTHAGIHMATRVAIHYIDSEEVEQRGATMLREMDAILVPGGFGARGIEGMIASVCYARENKIPYLGICLGMHVAVVEFARHVAGLSEAHSTEFDRTTPYPVIALVTEWTTADGSVETRDQDSDLGGTMRLGAQQCRLVPQTLAYALYDQEVIAERHRHRYEVNNRFIESLERAGLTVAGRSHDDQLVEMIELRDHPWFLAAQFHPEFTSSPRDGHPLFSGFVQAARKISETHEQQVMSAS